MAEKTKIEWADATVNHWAGCTKVSPASTPMGAVKRSGEFLRPFCENDAPFARMVRVGKQAAGRLLDGRTHDGFPAISHSLRTAP